MSQTSGEIWCLGSLDPCRTARHFLSLNFSRIPYNMNRHFTWIHVVFRRKYNMKLYFIDVHVVRLAEKQPASLIDTNLVRGGSRRTYLPVLPYGK